MSGIGAPLMAPLAALYGAAVAARTALYARGWLRRARVGVPVVSVGNLAAGGTGKTPMVALTARLLRDAGLRPVIVSRGYRGRRIEDPLVVADERGLKRDVTAAMVGDEPAMLGRFLSGVPVIVSRRRAEGAALAIARFGARCVVLDDGFQHLALERDLDLVLLEAARPLGSGRLLPAGLLREPPGALARADAVVLTGEGPAADELTAVVGFVRPGTPAFRLRYTPTLLVDAAGGPPRPVGEIQGRRVVAFAGIASPERLRRSLEGLGAEVAAFHPFADHHVFRAGEVRQILSSAEALGAEGLVTTEKDLARLEGTPEAGLLQRAGLAALRVEAFLPEEEMPAFRDLIFSAAARREA